VRISAFTHLPCDPGDDTVPPDLPNFLVMPIPGGLHLSWGDLPQSNTIVKVYIHNQPLETGDELGVLTMNYDTTQHEAVFPLYGEDRVVYVRAQTHNFRSCNDGPLTSLATVVTRAGQLLPLMVTAAPRSLSPGQVGQVTATGADSYDWDLDFDGVYEITGDTSGQASWSKGEPGMLMGRCKGYGAGGAVNIHNVSAVCRGWFSQVIDQSEYSGGAIQLVRLADGRPAALQLWNGEVHYCAPEDNLGVGPWQMKVLDTGLHYIDNPKLVVANQTPFVLLGHASQFGDNHQLRYYLTPSVDGLGDWTGQDIDPAPSGLTNGSTGGGGVDILGNTDTAESPGNVAVAYLARHDDDNDGGFDHLQGINFMLGMPDGAGDFNWGGPTRALKDYDGEDALGGIRNPRLATVNGEYVLLGNKVSPLGNQDNGVYAPYNGGNWLDLPFELAALDDVTTCSVSGDSGYFSVLFAKNGETHYWVSDNLLDPLAFTGVTLPGYEWVLNNTADGLYPRLLVFGSSTYKVFESNTQFGGNAADWTVEETGLAPFIQFPNGSLAYIGGSGYRPPAVAHITVPFWKLTYSVYF
jgi:hypothetical protein